MVFSASWLLHILGVIHLYGWCRCFSSTLTLIIPWLVKDRKGSGENIKEYAEHIQYFIISDRLIRKAGSTLKKLKILTPH